MASSMAPEPKVQEVLHHLAEAGCLDLVAGSYMLVRPVRRFSSGMAAAILACLPPCSKGSTSAGAEVGGRDWPRTHDMAPEAMKSWGWVGTADHKRRATPRASSGAEGCSEDYKGECRGQRAMYERAQRPAPIKKLERALSSAANVREGQSSNTQGLIIDPVERAAPSQDGAGVADFWEQGLG
ncbi:hypothetical protein NDU88_004901 [Pleurodeles waltl]|uniref:Uncharacterized protein n=1 Tax=Pleurodeles waltl TaxID=8319 RepID=A0AAV7MUT6_PLEWA|nr:hypothetical protein NDU88_004901 [Pleurodeles waltl]